jgi:2-polyprenyl-6-methoxyphenol hydroxylase-like FAD-dependent oxidoreductase
MSISDFKVIIIGAGIAGLCLAQILRKEGVPFEIFERDDGSRSQGWIITVDEYVLELTCASCQLIQFLL